jgi:DNA-binding SARP family transcriptional activator
VVSSMSFAVLGPVRAWRDGREIDPGTPQQRAVLAVLLLRAGAHVSAEDLVDTLWPEDPPKAAVNTIRTYVHRLRKLLDGADLIRSEGNAYILTPLGDALDVSLFQRLADRARRTRADGDIASAVRYLDEGLALWQGTPLAGIPGRFAETQRAYLEELKLAAIEDHADDKLALGRHADVIPALGALTDEYPYRERLRALLMTALYRASRRAEALAVFDQARNLLSTELGIDPGQQLRELHLRILNADPALMDMPAVRRSSEAGVADVLSATGPAEQPGESGAHIPPAQLPRDLPTFAGRRADIEFVLAGFADDSADSSATASVTVIAGMAGVGKPKPGANTPNRYRDMA